MLRKSITSHSSAKSIQYIKEETSSLPTQQVSHIQQTMCHSSNILSWVFSKIFIEPFPNPPKPSQMPNLLAPASRRSPSPTSSPSSSALAFPLQSPSRCQPPPYSPPPPTDLHRCLPLHHHRCHPSPLLSLRCFPSHSSPKKRKKWKEGKRKKLSIYTGKDLACSFSTFHLFH